MVATLRGLDAATVIDGLKPYPAYRDSGLRWIGDVPEHWDTRPAKWVFREVDHRSDTGSEELLSVSHITGVTPRSQKDVTMFMASSYVGYKLCRSGDLVVNTMWAWAGALGIAPQSGIVSNAYAVYRPLTGSTLTHSYANRLLRTPIYVDEYHRRSTGIQASRLRLYPDVFLRMPLLLPPEAEQAAIVRFLGHADLLIHRYIAAKQKLVTLLVEERRGIVQTLVTRGLDPDAELRPSGVPWIGNVPAGWEISRVKAEFESLNRHRIPLSSTERGEMTLRKYDYYGASGVIDKVDDYIFDDELLLIAEDGANLVLRNLPLAIIARGKFWVNNHAHILKPKRGNLEYLAALMEGLDYRPWISGAAQPKLTKDRLMSISIAVPSPTLQDEIMGEASARTSHLQTAIQHAEREIALLREYRTRLIADVVTGKLDVRVASASLPEPVEGDEMLHELVDAEDTNEDVLDMPADQVVA